MERITVVKIGGNVIDNPAAMKRFLKEFAALEGPKILVHGGGKLATRLAERLELKVQMVDGRRITDKGTLDVVTMVYAGLINKTIVAKLRTAGCNAVGLCGADGGLIVSRRRNPKPVDYGFVGDPELERFGTATAKTLIDAGYTLVVAPITVDGADGSLLNTNADTVARTMAVGLSGTFETELVYCFEKRGVLMDVDDDRSVIPEITPARFAQLRADGIVADGMLPKLENAFDAIEHGVRSVAICSADAVAEKGYGGTTLKAD